MRGSRLGGDGKIEEIMSTLTAQQRTLEGIVNMQADLRNLVKQQHRLLEKKIANFGQPCGDVGLQPQHESTADDVGSNSGGSKSGGQAGGASQAGGLNVFRGMKKDEKEEDEVRPKKRHSLLKTPKGPAELRAYIRKVLLHPWFDSVLGTLILLNFILIFVELEWKGNWIENRIIAQAPNDSVWLDVEPLFSGIDQAFNAIFLLELAGYLFTFGCQDCLKDKGRMLDIFAIVVSAIDSFILDPVFRGRDKVTSTFLRFIRVIRAFRLMRFLRVLRFMGVFSGLRVLVTTLNKSLGSLIWSMAVVGFLILSSALFISIVVQDVLEDEFSTLPLDTKLFLNKYYGGAFRCTYTMFEATFSAKWATHFSDKMIWEVSPWFMVFWVFYTVTVNFAVIRVLSALFLKQTLDVAAIDAERLAIKKMQEKQKICETLRAIFQLGDSSGDGVLERAEFEEMMEKEEVKEKFKSLELEAPELHLLYNILSEDDGVADQEEFLAGALKLKTQVQTLDVLQLMHEQLVLKRYIGELAGGLSYMDKALHPRAPWAAKSIMDLHGAHHGEGSSPRGPPTQGDMTVRTNAEGELKQMKF